MSEEIESPAVVRSSIKAPLVALALVIFGVTVGYHLELGCVLTVPTLSTAAGIAFGRPFRGLAIGIILDAALLAFGLVVAHLLRNA